MLRSSGFRLVVALVGAIALAVPASALGAGAPPALTGVISSPALDSAGPTSVAFSGQYAYTTEYYPGQLAAINISNPAAPTLAGASAAALSLENASTVQVVGGFAYVVSKNRNGPCMPGPTDCSAGTNDDGSGNSLTVLSLANPAVPTVVGAVTSGTSLFGAYGLAISGHYAYIAAQGCLGGQPCPTHSVGNSFDVIDLNNLAAGVVASVANPRTGSMLNALNHACAVSIDGNFAYVTAESSNQFTAIDISNPLNPTIVSTTQDNVNLANAVDVVAQGTHAYVADQTSNASHSNFTVIDISNPAKPAVVGSITGASALSGAYRLRVHGNFAYVSGSNSASVAAIDISDPANPRLVGSVTDPAHLNRTTGLDVDPTGHYVLASSPYLQGQTQPFYPPFPPAAGAPTLTGTASVITLDPAPIAVTIAPGSVPANPTNQTSASFSFSTTDAISSVACNLDAAGFGLCTTPTTQVYGSLKPGRHTFTVQATDAAGATKTASYTWTVSGGSAKTVGKPKPSHASLSGIAKRRAKLSFALAAGVNAGALKTIVVGLPKGLSFTKSKRSLAKGLIVKGSNGKKLKFTAKVSRGTLTITLKTAARSARITIANPAITVAASLAGNVKKHKVKSLTVILKTTDSSHRTVRLTVKLKPS